jgi:hypothetical protein
VDKNTNPGGCPGTDIGVSDHLGRDIQVTDHPSRDIRGADHPGQNIQVTNHPGQDIRVTGHPGQDIRGADHPSQIRRADHPGTDIRVEISKSFKNESLQNDKKVEVNEVMIQPPIKNEEDTFISNIDSEDVRTRQVVDCAVVLTELNVLIGACSDGYLRFWYIHTHL